MKPKTLYKKIYLLRSLVEAGLARIETLKASSSEAPKVPRIEMPKASRGGE